MLDAAADFGFDGRVQAESKLPVHNFPPTPRARYECLASLVAGLLLFTMQYFSVNPISIDKESGIWLHPPQTLTEAMWLLSECKMLLDEFKTDEALQKAIEREKGAQWIAANYR